VQELPWSPDPVTGFSMTLLRMLAFVPSDTPPAVSKPLLKAAATRIEVPVRRPSTKPEQPAPKAVEPVAAQTVQSSTGAEQHLGGEVPKVEDWPAFASTLPLSGFAAQLALQSVLIAQEGNCFVLRVATKPLGDKSNASRLEAALSQVTGARCLVKVEVGELAGAAAAPVTAHQRNEEAKAAKLRAAEEAVRNDPNVQELMATFGATIVPGSIKPLD
jgi:DNA polymerase-3 subunit gamma/tau